MDNVRLEARTDGDPIDTSKQHKCTSRLLMRWTLHQATSVVAKALTRCMLLEAAPHGHLSSTNKLLADPMTKSAFQKAPTERIMGTSGEVASGNSLLSSWWIGFIVPREIQKETLGPLEHPWPERSRQSLFPGAICDEDSPACPLEPG